ncbi:MAG: glycine cleavage system protein GcvH [Candidatus Omnitrophica bacterium]|nr:glycine cleavage system protein GcvH [Candidatus Omnitrophota bacterium]
MKIPDNLLYTKEHEWVLINGKKAKMGITDFAQEHLGDVTYVEPPDDNKAVKQFEMVTTIESVKAASDVYAPLSGKVTQFNSSLEASPELINKSPYEDGWIALIELSDESEKKNLMNKSQYEEYVTKLSTRE